jgi:hypothetical protein
MEVINMGRKEWAPWEIQEFQTRIGEVFDGLEKSFGTSQADRERVNNAIKSATVFDEFEVTGSETDLIEE